MTLVFCRAEFMMESRLDLGIWEQGLGKLGEKRIERQTEAKSFMEEMKLWGS